MEYNRDARVCGARGAKRARSGSTCLVEEDREAAGPVDALAGRQENVDGDVHAITHAHVERLREGGGAGMAALLHSWHQHRGSASAVPEGPARR